VITRPVVQSDRMNSADRMGTERGARDIANQSATVSGKSAEKDRRHRDHQPLQHRGVTGMFTAPTRPSPPTKWWEPHDGRRSEYAHFFLEQWRRPMTMASLTRTKIPRSSFAVTALGTTDTAIRGEVIATRRHTTFIGGGGAAGTTTVSILPWAIAIRNAGGTGASSLPTAARAQRPERR